MMAVLLSARSGHPEILEAEMEADNTNAPTEAGIALLCGDPTRLEEVRALAREIQAGRLWIHDVDVDRAVRCLALVPSEGTIEERAAVLEALIQADKRSSTGQHEVLVVDGGMLDGRLGAALAERMAESMILACSPRDKQYDCRFERLKPERPWEDNRRTRMGRTRAARRAKRGR